MRSNYERDLDLNLLRVFAVVVEAGSVTEAASRLYLTQPAVSVALRRLATAIGTPLFTRRGRGLALTSRGVQLRSAIYPHLGALVDAALSPSAFDPKTSDRTLRIGFADAAEAWLLPRLLEVLGQQAPNMRVISLPVQFRTVGAALASGMDAAVTVADELPSSIRRLKLFGGGHVCLFDPRELRLPKRLTEARYLAHDHVIVSYNGDLRGLVEDLLGRQRRIRCSVSTFANIGAIVEGSSLIATVPAMVAEQIRSVRPKLATRKLPFETNSGGAGTELLWLASSDSDDAARFVRDKIIAITSRIPHAA